MRLLTIGAMQQQTNMVDLDLKIYLDSLTTPLSAGQINLLNTFVKDLKTGLGITRLYDAFDQMLIHANETIESGLNNLVKRSHDATLSATAPAFTALEGFTGNGSNAYIDTNYNPGSQGVNYLQDNSSVGFYQRTLISEIKVIVGVAEASGYIIFHANGSLSRINNITGDPVTSVLGMNVMSRSEAANWNFHGNKNAAVNVVRASTGVPNQNVFLLAYNNDGTGAGNHTKSQISLSYVGKSFNQTEINVIYDTFQAYMTANGKQV